MRKHYIDFLRVFTVLLLVPYHSARIYDYLPFYIKEDSNLWLHLFSYFLHQWRMPILFLVSGVGTYFLLKSRSTSVFIKDRLTRLLVPFIFAVLVVVPPQGYYAKLDKGLWEVENFFEYYPHFFTFDLSKIDGFTGTFTPAHMWFILYLVIFSLLSIPVFSWIKGRKDYFNRSSIQILWLTFPLFLANIVLMGIEMNPIFYFILFIYGFLLMKEKKLEAFIEEKKLLLLVVGLCTMSIVLYLEWYEITYHRSLIKNLGVFLFLKTVNTFSWVFAIIGYAKKYVNTNSTILAKLNKNVFTIYILHQTIIIWVGYYVHQLNFSSWSAYFIILVLTYIFIAMFIYVVITRFKLLRILFGSK